MNPEQIARLQRIEQKLDHDATISRELLAEIQEFGTLVKLAPKYLRPLEKLRRSS